MTGNLLGLSVDATRFLTQAATAYKENPNAAGRTKGFIKEPPQIET
jgi:hypothetical protein